MWFGNKKILVKNAAFNQEVFRHRRETGNPSTSAHGGTSKQRALSRGDNGIINNHLQKVSHGLSYAQVANGNVKDLRFQSPVQTPIKIQPVGNGWLFRSVVATLHKMISLERLEMEVKKEVKCDVQLRSMGGRFILTTFPVEKQRDEAMVGLVRAMV